MVSFLNRYRQLVIFLPLWLVIGDIHPILGYFSVLCTLSFWLIKGKYSHIYLALLIIMVLADSYSSKLNFKANLRIPILFFLVIITLKKMFQGRFKFKKSFLFCIPFFATAFFSILFSPSPMMAFAKTVSYIFLLLVVLHLTPYLVRKSNGQFLIDITYVIAFVIILPLCVYVIAPELVTKSIPTFNLSYDGSGASHFINKPYTGVFVSPNGLGLFTTLIIPLIIIIANIIERKKRFFITLGLLIFVCIIASQSRTALGAVTIFYGLYFFRIYLLNKEVYWRRKVGELGKLTFNYLIFPTIALLLIVIGPEAIIEFFGLSQRFRVHTLFTGAGRLIAWEDAWTVIKNNIWFGKGFHFDTHHFRERFEILSKLGHLGGAHNSYVSLLMNVGIVGLIFFIFFIINLFIRIKGYARKFIFPYLVLIILSTNLESWLAGSINYVTIFFYLTLVLLIHFNEFEQMNRRPTYRIASRD